MKKFLFALSALFLLLPTAAMAADFRSSGSGSVNIGQNEQTSNLYAAGQNIVIDGRVNKDLAAAGSFISLNGDVENSAFLAGSTLNINGNIGGNLRVAGSNITISKNVKGDFFAAGSTITLAKDASIDGDLIVASATADIAGHVKGNVKIVASTINLSGKVDGNFLAKNVSNLTLTNTAVVGGKLTYTAPSESNSIDKDAKVLGGVDYSKSKEFKVNNSHLFLTGLTAAALIYKMISVFLILLIIIYLLPKFCRNFVAESYKNTLANLGWGFFTLLAVPIAIIILFSLILTIGLAFGAMLAYILLVIIAGILAGLLLGSGIIRLIAPDKEFRLDWLTALVGALAVTVIGSLPIFGGLVVFFFFLVALGTLGRMVIAFIVNNQKQR